MSIKRIIELEEVKVNGQKYYKAVGCNTLFFDKNGFKNITKPYVEGKQACTDKHEANVKEENKLLNCKFRILQSSPGGGLMAGNVYEVIDGRFMDSYGMISPIFAPLKDKRSLERFLTGIDFEILEEE